MKLKFRNLFEVEFRFAWHGTMRQQVRQVFINEGYIPAVKRHRELTGAGLKESIVYVQAFPEYQEYHRQVFGKWFAPARR